MTFNIVLYGDLASKNADRLTPLLEPDWHLSTWTSADSTDRFKSLLIDADVIIGGPLPISTWPSTPRLKLVQVPWAGYDWTNASAVPTGVPFCNCYEHEAPIAEYVILSMLEARIGLRQMDRTIRERGWDGRGPGNSRFHGELAGATIGIVGYGHIGEQVARRATALDMRIIGIRRKPQETPDPLAWLGTADQLERLLGESDFVLICCDLNDETRNLINEKTLAQMKPTGWLINVARGAVVNEDALYNALASEQIGGAVIDTWYNYPSPDAPDVWPSNKPFGDLPNTILSAHECAWTEEVVRRRWLVVADNLARVYRGDMPLNLLFTGTANSGDKTKL